MTRLCPTPRAAVLALVVLAVAGLVIRIGAAATVRIWFDEATMGLMGRDVLHGEFPPWSVAELRLLSP